MSKRTLTSAERYSLPRNKWRRFVNELVIHAAETKVAADGRPESDRHKQWLEGRASAFMQSARFTAYRLTR